MIFQFKITLAHSDPKIWRRVRVPADLTFDDFHVAIQIAMGWEDVHFYVFNMGQPYASDRIELIDDEEEDAFIFGPKYESHNAELMSLNEYFSSERKKINYIYDMGDGWWHQIHLEKILDDILFHPVCLAGEGACPPEDVGGLGGYYHLLEVLSKPTSKEAGEMRKWLGMKKNTMYEDYHKFDMKDVNEALRETFNQ